MTVIISPLKWHRRRDGTYWAHTPGEKGGRVTAEAGRGHRNLGDQPWVGRVRVRGEWHRVQGRRLDSLKEAIEVLRRELGDTP